MTLSQHILSIFKGRPDYFACATSVGFEPVEQAITPDTLEAYHLDGAMALGFYVLDADSKCHVACVDFDNKPEHPDEQWRAKAESLYFELCSMNLQPLVELSQSGNGAHVWIVFDEATDAWIPRAFFKAVGRKLDVVYREIFPKQDRLNGKGLGNLVRYPLWGKSAFVSVEDGWNVLNPIEALTGVQRVSGADLRMVAWDARLGNLEPSPISVGDGGELSPRVLRAIEKPWTLAGARWLNDARHMNDTSPSAVAMALATELVRQYVPTPEVEAALRVWCRMHAPDKAHRNDWIAGTVLKAYQFIGERTTSRASSGVITLRDCAIQYVDVLRRGGEQYIKSGIEQIDNSIDGVALGEMAVIAARPGEGKTALALQWLDNASAAGIPCLLVSNEMNAMALGKRRLSSISEIDNDIWDPNYADYLQSEVDTYHEGRAPVYVAESVYDIARVEEVVEQMVGIHGVKLVAIDYLQLCRQSDAEKRFDEVSEVSRRIKAITMRHGVAMLALCQLNRASDNRTDREPQLTDLRESGQIEQDCDLACFLQWPIRFNPKSDPREYRVFFKKRRNGPIRESRITTQFDARRQMIGGKSWHPN